MPTKTLSGVYANGYYLASVYTAVSVTSAGQLTGSYGYAFYHAAGGGGGVGLGITHPATGYNFGDLTGGYGGAGANADLGFDSYIGGYGGPGLFQALGVSVNNYAKIYGGTGGPGGVGNAGAGGFGNYGAGGGQGGAGVWMAGAGSIYNSVGHHIYGGTGGTGGYGTLIGGDGGAGGAGVSITAGGTVNNYGVIVGGYGGAKGGTGVNGVYGAGGVGGNGVTAHGGTILNRGDIAGGVGQVYGDGVELYDGARLINDASVTGYFAVHAYGAVTVVNYGTLHGLSGYSVDMGGPGGRLVDKAGGVFIGIAAGNLGATLELAVGGGTITGLGGSATLTGGGSLVSKGFGTYQLDAGIWAIPGAAMTNAQTVNVEDSATVQMQGVIGNSGAIVLAGAISLTDLRVQAAGATLSGGGAVTMSGPKARILGVSAATVLTNVDNTIAGVGFIGLNQLTLVNEAAGVIDASTKGSLVVRTTGEVLTNAGLMEASGGGLLVITQTTVNNVGGTIEAAVGSVVDLSDDVIEGGTLGMAGGGPINVNVAGGELDGSTHAVTLGGLVQLLAGKTLILDGAIANAGRLNTFAGSSTADLIVGAAGATLSGKGSVNLSNSLGNRIYGLTAADVLTNVDNHIDGAGLLGKGVLTLVNDAAGQIIGNQNLSLTIDTGANTILNAGLIENVGKGGTLVKSAVNNTGSLVEATAGTLTLAGKVTGTGVAKVSGGTLYVQLAFAENVTFNGTTGVLKLGDSQAYTGKITGLSKTGTDWLDLADIGYFSATTKASFSGTTASGVLTVTDGTHTAKITLIGNYTGSTFTVSSDGHGGTKVVDPASPASAPFIAAMAAFGSHGAAVAVAVEPWRGTVAALAAPRPHPAL